MAENMFDGFDHTRYKDEVEERWGKDAYARSDAWWRAMTADEKKAWQQRVSDLGRDWIATAESGRRPTATGPGSRAASRRVADSASPAHPPSVAGWRREGIRLGLGEMYVADPRFGANYATSDGGTAGAEFVRDALRVYADANL